MPVGAWTIRNDLTLTYNLPTVVNGVNAAEQGNSVTYMLTLSRKLTESRNLRLQAVGGINARNTTVGVLEDLNRSGRPRGRITLKPAYTLTGNVTDPDGKGIPAAYVRLLQGQNHLLVTEVFTDSNGVYHICSIPPLENYVRDSYTITAGGDGCNAACQVETGWSCTGVKYSSCSVVSGDGYCASPHETCVNNFNDCGACSLREILTALPGQSTGAVNNVLQAVTNIFPVPQLRINIPGLNLNRARVDEPVEVFVGIDASKEGPSSRTQFNVGKAFLSDSYREFKELYNII